MTNKQARKNKIAAFRVSKDLSELERKAIKARRKSIFTQEEIDLANVKGRLLAEKFQT